MQLTARTPLARARAAVAVAALAAVVVILGGAFTVAGLVVGGHAGLAAVAAGGTFAAYFFTSRMTFDALDRLGDVRRHRTAEQHATPTRLAPPAQIPGRHRPETFAQTHTLPAVAPAGTRS